jgi:hypothetical protein
MTPRQPLHPDLAEARADLRRTWRQAYPTINPYAASLVTAAADSEWLLRRVERRYDEINQQLFQIPMSNWTKQNHALYQRATRYLTTRQLALERHRRAINYFLTASDSIALQPSISWPIATLLPPRISGSLSRLGSRSMRASSSDSLNFKYCSPPST